MNPIEALRTMRMIERPESKLDAFKRDLDAKLASMTLDDLKALFASNACVECGGCGFLEDFDTMSIKGQCPDCNGSGVRVIPAGGDCPRG